MTRPGGWKGPWASVPRRFFDRDPLLVAPELLGLVLATVDADGLVRAGRIVEVEAYCGEDDPASHAFRGMTARTEVMFGPPGHLYVYRSYGMHWCSNMVCSRDGTAGAVLVRALEPCAGVEAMWPARPKAHRETDLSSGPGKLCAALAITGADNGTDLTRDGRVALVRGFSDSIDPSQIAQGARVGISVATDYPWRWRVATSRHLSRGAVAGGA